MCQGRHVAWEVGSSADFLFAPDFCGVVHCLWRANQIHLEGGDPAIGIPCNLAWDMRLHDLGLCNFG